jgi:hypothetical protein
MRSGLIYSRSVRTKIRDLTMERKTFGVKMVLNRGTKALVSMLLRTSMKIALNQPRS